MSKLNTDAKRKEFIKKFTIAWNTPTERWRIPADPGHVWNWTDQSLQQAYQKGGEEERENAWIACRKTVTKMYQKFSTEHHTHNAFEIELEDIEPDRTKELWKAIKRMFMKELKNK